MSLQLPNKLTLQQGSLQYQILNPEELLRQLVEQVERSEASDQTKLVRRTSDTVEEVVFAIEIDGVLYTLVRSLPQSANQTSLSPRELAIARLIAKGLPNKAIGTILEISQWTVATHIRRIFAKLDVTTRAAMVAKLGEDLAP